MTKNKPLTIIAGKSGSGKTTIAEKLEEDFGLISVQSYTTRKPRYEGERGHIFITEEEYLKTPKEEIMAYTFFDGNHYFATRELLDNSDVYVVDPDGIEYMKDRYTNKTIKVVTLKVSLFTRIFRMIKRGDKPFNIIQRVRNDYKKFKGIDKVADFTLKNKNVCSTVANIVNLVMLERRGKNR